MNPQDIAIFTGNANSQLAVKTARHLGLELGHARVARFADGKPDIRILEDVRGRDVYIIQPDGPPPMWYMELEQLIASAKRSASRVTVIIPYFSSGRGDRRDESGKAIPAAVDAKKYAALGVDRIVLFELHAEQIVGMFEAAGVEHIDSLYFRPIVLDHLSRHDLSNAIFSPPDVGRMAVVRSLWRKARAMGFPVELGLIDKDGTSSSGIQGMTVLGDFEGRHAHLFDDIFGSTETAVMASRAALDRGALDVTLWVAHAVFPDRDTPEIRRAAFERLANSPIKCVNVSDSLPLSETEREVLGDKLQELSASMLFAMAIKRLHEPRSGHRLSSLFELDGYREGLKEFQATT